MRFAEKVNAKHYYQWESAGLGKWSGAFEPYFIEAATKAKRIHFNLSGMDVDLARASKIDFNLGRNVTNSELNTILNSSSLREKTIFYRDGIIVPIPK